MYFFAHEVKVQYNSDIFIYLSSYDH